MEALLEHPGIKLTAELTAQLLMSIMSTMAIARRGSV